MTFECIFHGTFEELGYCPECKSINEAGDVKNNERMSKL